MEQGTSGLSPTIVAELIKVAADNARALMDLRQKHFRNFLAVTGVLGAVVFQVEAGREFRIYLATIGLVVTGLFWLLDRRTQQHFRAELQRVERLEALLGVPVKQPSSGYTLMRANTATNLLFLIAMLWWAIVAVVPAENFPGGRGRNGDRSCNHTLS